MRNTIENICLLHFHCEKCLNFYSRLFSFMTKFVVEWNGVTIHSTGLYSRTYLWFYFNFIFVVSTANTGACVGVYLQRQLFPTASPLLKTTLYIQISIVFLILGFLTLANCFDSFILKCKQIKLFYSKLNTKHKFTGKNERSSWKSIATGFKVITVVAAVLPLFVTVIRVVVANGSTDPICWTIYQIFSGIENKVCSRNYCRISLRIVTVLFQFMFTYVRIMETVRLTLILFLVHIYFMEMQITSLNKLQHICRERRNNIFLHTLYSAWRLAHQSSNYQYFIGTIMGLGFWVFVLGNVFTIMQLRNDGSWKYFIHFPVITIGAGFYTVTALRAIADINSQSQNLIRYMQQKSGLVGCKAGGISIKGKYQKLVQKLWKSAQPVWYSCGPTFPLAKGIDCKYLHLITLRTSDGLLLVNLK